MKAPLKDRFRRLRRETAFVVGVLMALMVVLASVWGFLLRGEGVSTTLVTNRVLIFILWYINVILIFIILFVIVRYIVKLFLDRRTGVLGSRFKIKLVATYIGMTMIPVSILFFFGSDLMNETVDRWVNAPGVESLALSAELAQGYHSLLEEEAERGARSLVSDIGSMSLQNGSDTARLTLRLHEGINPMGIDLFAVYEGRSFVTGVVDPRSGLMDLPDVPREFLEEIDSKGEATRRLSGVADSLLILAGVRIVLEEDGRPVVLISGRYMDPKMAALARDLIQANQGFRQIKVQQAEIKASQILLFRLITLTILLASVWVGIHLANRITGPIQELVKGTRRISHGDLSHRVEVDTDDELGILITSFNRMTHELQTNKQLVETKTGELTEANRRLAEERALVIAVLQSITAGVVAIDREEVVFICNGTALGLLKQTEADMVGRPIRDAWADPERAKLLDLLKVTDVTRPWGRSQVRLIIAGEWKSFEVSVSMMRDREGDPSGWVLVIEDLTELIKAQKLAAWREAARRIAHEIKNPLTPIQLAAERIKYKYQGPEDPFKKVLHDGVGIIVHEVDVLKRMVDEFSRFAKMPGPQPKKTDLTQLLEGTTKLYRDLKAGVDVEFRVGAGAEVLWVDPEQLKGALINLLDNAVEASEAPGKVSIRAERLGKRISIAVADTGSGIAVEDRGKLFLPHFSRKGRGTGLGLAIVHRIVSEHHGTIRVEDNVPQGTVFTIELPVV